ncbi:MAG: rRNA maturation RNase YbeY [Myxococcota bacterium]
MAVLIRTERLQRRSIRIDVIRKRAQRMLQVLPVPPHAELSVLLCEDAQIRILNREFRGIDAPTDVLAFPMHDLTSPIQEQGSCSVLPSPILGDVAISIGTSRRQAQQQGRSLSSEVTMLLAHGLLHLIGYDHRTAEEESVMTKETERLCAAACLSRP